MLRVRCLVTWILFFFFQAEDGIRDDLVTGVQTCALPISGERDLVRQGWPRLPPRDPLLGGRQYQDVRRGVVSPAQGGLRRDRTSWRQIASLAEIGRAHV